MRKLLVTAAAAASLVGGSFAVAAINPLGIAGAQDGTSTTTQPPPTTAPRTEQPDKGRPGPGHGHRKGPGGEFLGETLDELVANGTITQVQADAIRDGVKTKAEAWRKDHPGKGGPGFELKGGMFETAAKAIGIEPKDLMTEIRDGKKTIAQVATDHQVDPQKVIDAIVADVNGKIDAAVAAGKLPTEKASEIKSHLAERVTEMVNHQPGERKGRGHR